MPSPRRIFPLFLILVMLSITVGCSESPTAPRTKAPAPPPAPGAWLTTIGSTDYDESHDVAVDASGNVYVVGSLSAPVDFGGQIFDPTGAPVFLAKYSRTGEFEWIRRIRGAGPDGPLSLSTDNSGGVFLQGIFITRLVIDGQTISSNGGADHVFVSRFDANGNVLWTSYDTAPWLSVAFAMDTGVTGVTAVTGFYQVGAEFGDAELSVQGFDFFVVSYDGNGNALWAHSTGSDSRTIGAGAAVDPSNNVILAGEFYGTTTFGSTELTSSGNRDAFIAKYSSTGDVLWAHRMGTDADDAAYGIATDSDGDIYLSGRRWGSPVSLWKYNADGEQLWEAEAPQASDIALDASNNIFLSGSFTGTYTVGTSEITSNGYNDFFVARFDPSGNGSWAVSGGASQDDRAQGLAVDRYGAPIVVVDFRDSFDFAGETVTSKGEQDLMVFRLE